MEISCKSQNRLTLEGTENPAYYLCRFSFNLSQVEEKIRFMILVDRKCHRTRDIRPREIADV